MAEATANSKEKNEIKVSTIILPENKNYESESLKYEINIPNWLLEIIQNYEVSNKKNNSNQDLIVKAFKLAYEAHNGQLRASGEPYIIHPLAVADLLKEIGASSSVVAAGLLHDVVEDTGIALSEIEVNFGLEVKVLVEGVTKLGGIHFNNRTEAQAENLRKMFLAMASDIRVVLVKLADRLHNMRTIQWLNEERKERIARETREIYAPLANRLGINRFKWELEDLAFKFLEPEEYKNLKDQIAVKRSDREKRLNVTLNLMKENLVSSGLVNFEITGRPKHLYGIWSKMERQQKQFGEIYDVAALRIIVSNTDSCYKALAVVHDTFRPIPGRFKDYIGLPKPNGYQSLHTSVIGRHRPIEVQIRTSSMHQIAEFGIAAHWQYKEGGSPASSNAERFNWLRQLVEWQQEGNEKDHNDYLASIKEDLFDEEVFVITPKGDVVGLRKGSTAIDFAYRIHSEIGNHCNGIRINEKLSPLSTSLQNGDFIEILTNTNSTPSLDWLNFVVTPTAKNRIRQWYKKSHRDETIKRGKDLLEKEIGRNGFESLISSDAMKKVAHRCNLKSTEDLLASLGFGGLTLHQVLNRLREEIKIQTEEIKNESNEELARSLINKNNSIATKSHATNKSPITGVEGLDYRIGKCCSPLPGEEIIGTVSLGNHGITIHRRDCENVIPIPIERRLPVAWNQENKILDNKFPIQLRIEVIDRVGVLKDILMRLSDKGINVSDANVKTAFGKPAIINLCVGLESYSQLHKTIDQIKSMADVLDIARVGIS
ncbi:guanosine-3',5'-bis(diphosphate) 3'-diphosphatase, (ppGpp)ase [Prochlorococcus marinus subsp. pastoris str. CCMP1986]|uniref:Guanosine-3',5'-bis(Diphosphate) 3'-diphosphatase, (PpGpp)ase n=1 Tax=Prochlorococcus marinus subsp. pastoris (strain CCMP1986 / NIES-2087 / MED4) TaxID=59919 RepID=Q7TUG7_PROMP|nr:bifunctional (p)ppGpp synthetase/guanosine-3',5'-bis(diphosphate) 3'-pyrophosphohydrolase [Prochlorococcus marinus]KGF88056.1 GTP pyrophosphokinase [Prochlorococcus marinus str. EQPAC1]CAE18650.1 guanosine-3',5'-bis(diphosphate) 3'-diphosphatase, (ppGpp)ase [Prochlorococcus marinus subsp. pastoris str. CCMP1986]